MKLCKILIVALIAVMCFSCVTASAEETPITVMLDGEYIQFDVQPVAVEGRTLVPMRAVFEALGAEVEWIAETQTAAAKKGDVSIAVQLDNTQMKVNDKEITLDVPARAMNNRTLVPIRAISEAFDCHVSWNGGKRCVVIVSDLANTEIMNVNGESVSAGYFNYCLYNAELSLSQGLGTTLERIAEMWSTSLGDMGFDEYISDIAAEQVVVIKTAVSEAKKLGMEITQSDKDSITQTIDSLKANYTTDEDYQNVLKMLGTSEEALVSYLTDVMYVSKMYEKYEDEYGMNDAEIKKYLDDNYVQAQHVLISTEGLDDAEKAEKKELALEVFEKAKAGEDFSALIAQYGEDPGMISNPEGYLFTKGEMVQEFETAAFSLKVDSISTVVETAYGYHIIKRVANVYTDDILEQTKTMLVSDKVDAVFDGYAEAAAVTKNQNMFSVIVPVGV